MAWLAILAGCGPCAAERVLCPMAADTYVYATPWDSTRPDDSEAYDNHGGEAQVVIKGREYFSLLQFDLAAARGLTVEKATLRIYRNANAWPLSTVGVSTISGSGTWGEGVQRGGRAQAGSANYFFARTPDQPWAYAGSDLTAVTFGAGGSLYAYVQPRDAGEGWWEIDIPPALVEALLSDDQFGWVLTDEKGQVNARHSLSSREQSQRQPALIVEGKRADQSAPGPVVSLREGGDPVESSPGDARALGRTTLRPGSAILRFGGAGDDAGQGIAARYELRYSRAAIDDAGFAAATPVPRWMLDPLAPKPDPLAISNERRDEVTAVVEDLEPGAVYYFAARALDEAGNAGPVSALGRYRAYARSWPPLPAAAAPAPARRRPAAPRRAADPAVRLWAFPELLKVNLVTGELVEQGRFPDHRRANAVWDAESATVRLTGARNEFVAFQIAIESAGPLAGIEARVAEPLFANVPLPAVFAETGAVQIYREWFVADDEGWYPDALVPAAAPLDLPARDNAVPGQTVLPLFVDIYIPHGAEPGLHTGRLRVLDRDITVNVQVLPLTLPDALSFTISLNGYGGVNGGYAGMRRGTPEYRALVHAYHRVAHLHRANLDILGYSHSGSVEPDYSPPLAGEGGDTRVARWDEWDAHFGPLLDGSAFAGLPRGEVPIQALYLNFFENWPGDLRASYQWNNYPPPATTDDYRRLIARHGLEAGPIEEGFPQSYQERFSAVARDFAEHFRARGWIRTRYMIYFNDKYFYKDPARGGRGVSWWLLDEPNHRDDVRAISFFGYLAKRWLTDYPDVPIVFRTDISYIDFMRDLLAGQVDLNTVSQRFFSKNRYLLDDRTRHGREFWNYSSTNHPRDSNEPMRTWCWRVWAAGGDGVVPWNTIPATAEVWNRAEPLTVFYPGSKFGRLEPYTSLRLKAFRRGQQDVEYLALLARREGWDREAVSHAVADKLDGDLDELRLRVARAAIGE